MPVRWLPDGGNFANSFVYGNILIDAGIPPMAVSRYRDVIDVIILTHCHYDHTAHITAISGMCDAEVMIHASDAPGMSDERYNLAPLFGARSPPLVPDRLLKDGDIIGSLEVIHTPGHTAGSICLYDRERKTLFSGDTVFTGGSFGRCDFPGGDAAALRDSLNRLADLEVEALYPGHGEPVEAEGIRHIHAASQVIRGYL